MKACAVSLAIVLSLRASGWGASAPAGDLTLTLQGVTVLLQGVGTDAQADVKDVVNQQLALAGDETVSPPLADDLAFFVRQRYFELGYRSAAVSWDISGKTAVLHVREGVRFTVGAIRFEGLTVVSEDELTQYLLRPTHEKLNSTSRNPPAVEADLRTGAELVQRDLQGQGYLDASVSAPVFVPHPESATEDVILRVKQGRRFVFGEIQISGELLGLDKEVDKKIKDLPRQPFNEVKAEQAKKEIVGLYQGRGHFGAVVDWKADAARHADGTIPVRFRITPGPLYHIARIDIAPGFSKGAQRLARASFKPAQGKVYSPADLEVMHRRLLDTNIFSKLELKPKPAGNDTLILELTGEEGMKRTVAAYGGFETFQGPIFGLESRDVNFMDTGDAVRLKGEINGLGFNGAVKWLDPAIFNSPYSFDVEVAAQNFAVFDYERRTVSVRSTLGRHWNRHIYGTLFAEGSTNKVRSDVLSPDELGPPDYKMGAIGATLTLDFRDSPVLPTKGWFVTGGLAQTFGDVNYLRTDVMFCYYQPIVKKLRAAFSARTSALHSSGGVTEVPIDLRLFNGGATTVRSFAEREMGAHSASGTPLGGTLTQVFNAELSYEIAPSLELALFGDVGRLSPVLTNPFSPPKDLRYGVGLGIRYKLPIGPLRIDYGFNPDRKNGEAFGALHITFGFAF